MTKQLFKLTSNFRLIFKKNTDTTDKKAISSLAPKVLTEKEEIDKIQPYLDKLKEAVDEKGINNIALTGSYGSGKSTIVKTFQHLNGNYKYLNISLASFNQPESIISSDTEKTRQLKREELERLLEVSILQQIFYTVKPSQIPESRFKRIINISKWGLWCKSIGFIVWLLSIVSLIRFHYLDKINPDNWNADMAFDWIALIIFLIASFGIGYFSKFIVELFSNSKINKVNIKGELELGEDINKSVFNEHLEEILYFFERTKYNVVVIEDLDRFETTDIFTKLREINILLNNSKLIKRDVKFVYAVGDSLFKDKKERVKFFEYIIPIIPFINSSNAEEQLRVLINDAGLEKDIFPKEFLSDVVTFIDDIDMRLLINIFHEFVIYRNTLKPDLVKKPEELFAIIIYKNLNLEDFHKLNNNCGKLYKLINDKEKYIDEVLVDLDEQIKQKRNQIKLITKEKRSNIDELKAVYINKILSKLPENGCIEKSAIEDLSLIENQPIPYFNYNSYYRRLDRGNFNYNLGEIEKEIDSEYTYKERLEFVKAKHNDKVEILREEIQSLQNERSKIKNWDLKQIFKEVDITEYLNGFANNKLLRNLVLNGYINEDYNNYISLFHEGSITKEDFAFERNVKSGFKTNFEYKLSKIESLIRKIDDKYFERESILNFDVVDFLGDNTTKYPNKYDSIIKLLSNEKQLSIEFIDEYIGFKDRPLKIFIEKLVLNWKGFCEYIECKSEYPKEKKERYFRLIIQFAENDVIIDNQNTVVLTEVINGNTGFMSLVKDIENKKIEDLFKKLDVKIEKLSNPDTKTKRLFQYVYQNNHYEINMNNISLLLNEYGENILDQDINERNYTTVLKSDCKALIEYVNSNINTYVKNVFLKLSDNKLEAENSLISLLNNKELKTGLRTQIIQKTETVLTNLEEIKDVEVKKQLLTYNKVAPIWDNVTHYYSTVENSIDETLVDFLNTESVYTELGEEKMPKNSEGFDYPSFRETIILCNEISYDSYTTILRGNNYQRNFISNGELNVDEDKAKFLAENIFATTKQNYDLFRDNHGDYHIILVENDFETFINENDDFEIDGRDVLSILKSEKIDDADKLRYIPLISEQIIVDNREVSKLINRLIINNDTKVELSNNTLKAVIENYSSIEDNIRLINIYYDDLNEDEIIELVSSFGADYGKMFQRQCKPTFQETVYHEELFGCLERSGLIHKFETDKKNSDLIRVTANYR